MNVMLLVAARSKVCSFIILKYIMDIINSISDRILSLKYHPVHLQLFTP